MDKIETSQKPVSYRVVSARKLGPTSKSRPYDPSKTLRDPKFIQTAIIEALKDGDLDAVKEIYSAHLRVLNRSKVAAKLNVSRQHVHRMLKTANPRLDTLVQFMGLLKDEMVASRA